MMTPHSISRLASLALAVSPIAMMAAVATVRAEPATGPAKKCRPNEDTFRVLTLTTLDGGARVDYEFVVSGRATWTDTNRPLLKQSGVRAGRTLCLPRDTQSANATPVE